VKNLSRALPQTEFKQAASELLPERRATHVDALLLEDFPHPDTDRPPVGWRQLFRDPFVHGLPAVLVFVELDGVAVVVGQRIEG